MEWRSWSRSRTRAAVVDDPNTTPDFGAAIPVELEGRGFRSMETLGSGTAPYVIVAGPVSDECGEICAIPVVRPRDHPIKVEGVDLTGIKPEGAMSVPGQNLLQLLSDDDDICSDEGGDASKRRFRSIDVPP